ncbi:glycosyltransferase family 2 protein [Candidatus Oscillochloris fontis]|uniref:glycosyltransferase family 2 protein n=1 Tax=Candidatus Oscillochloris fontis TaxID=2496868 RepID=UPI00101D1B02|nr:glycosyltransferase family 2 protein [Candidatus Oscillochloris fontis]
MKLSIVIPARNEAGNIGATIDGLRTRLSQAAIPYEILVVDDGSSDATCAVVEERAATDPGVRLERNLGAHGFGRAVRYGLERFTGDAVVVVMADASDNPDDIVRYYYILRDEAECVFGSRFVRGGRIYDYPRFKLVINRLANHFIKTLFRLRSNDITNAFKGYRAEVIRGCQPLISPHFNLTVEIPLKAIVRGYSYKVIPISWHNRKTGVSSLKLEEQGSRYLFIVLYVWLEHMLTKGDYRRPRTESFQPWVARSRTEQKHSLSHSVE